MGLQKQRRMRRRSEFQKALRDGNRARDAILAITAVDSGDRCSEPRYGFAIPKRVGRAVTRNRIKRRLRAIARHADHPKGWDFVIYAFPAAADATFEQLSASVERLVRRLMSRTHTRKSATRKSAGRTLR